MNHVEMYCILILSILCIHMCSLSCVDAFSEQLEAEEEQQIDERTLLDIFGEVAKEHLTQRVVSGR